MTDDINCSINLINQQHWYPILQLFIMPLYINRMAFQTAEHLIQCVNPTLFYRYLIQNFLPYYQSNLYFFLLFLPNLPHFFKMDFLCNSFQMIFLMMGSLVLLIYYLATILGWNYQMFFFHLFYLQSHCICLKSIQMLNYCQYAGCLNFTSLCECNCFYQIKKQMLIDIATHSYFFRFLFVYFNHFKLIPVC